MPIPKKWKRELPPSNDPQRPPKGPGSVSQGYLNLLPGGAGKKPGEYEREGSDGRA